MYREKVHQHKLESMLIHRTVVSFYDTFDLMFKGSEDMATKGVQNWPLSFTALLTDASLRESRSEYPHLPPKVRQKNLVRKGNNFFCFTFRPLYPCCNCQFFLEINENDETSNKTHRMKLCGQTSKRWT